jgi:hypothetical protein
MDVKKVVGDKPQKYHELVPPFHDGLFFFEIDVSLSGELKIFKLIGNTVMARSCKCRKCRKCLIYKRVDVVFLDLVGEEEDFGQRALVRRLFRLMIPLQGKRLFLVGGGRDHRAKSHAGGQLVGWAGES